MEAYKNGRLWFFYTLLLLTGSSCEKGCGKEYKVEFQREDLQPKFDIDQDGTSDILQYPVLFYLSEDYDENVPEPAGYCLWSRAGYTFLIGERATHYLKSGDQIALEPGPETGLNWSFKTLGLIKNQHCNNLYFETWDIVESDQLPHYIAIKKEDSTGTKLGWIKLEYDTDAGLINVAETVLRSDTSLVFE